MYVSHCRLAGEPKKWVMERCEAGCEAGRLARGLRLRTPRAVWDELGAMDVEVGSWATQKHKRARLEFNQKYSGYSKEENENDGGRKNHSKQRAQLEHSGRVLTAGVGRADSNGQRWLESNGRSKSATRPEQEDETSNKTNKGNQGGVFPRTRQVWRVGLRCQDKVYRIPAPGTSRSQGTSTRAWRTSAGTARERPGAEEKACLCFLRKTTIQLKLAVHMTCETAQPYDLSS